MQERPTSNIFSSIVVLCLIGGFNKALHFFGFDYETSKDEKVGRARLRIPISSFFYTLPREGILVLSIHL